MTDETLKKYISEYGDRMVVRQFCERSSMNPNGSISEVVNDLRNRLEGKDKKLKCGLKVYDNKNAQKNERRIELGWLNLDKTNFKQVRYKSGGGTRHIKSPIKLTMKDLQHRAESLFFPNGKSKVGPLSDFDRSMMDFTEELIDPSVTLGELYEQKQVNILRVYLATKKKSISENKNREDQSNGTSKDEVENKIFDSDENNLPDLNMSASGPSCDSANQFRSYQTLQGTTKVDDACAWLGQSCIVHGIL